MTREQAITILRRLPVPITEATIREWMNAAIASGDGDTVEAINVLGYGGALAALAVDESLGARPPVEPPTIVVHRGATGWTAHLASRVGVCGCGDSRREAIGDCIAAHPGAFGIVIDLPGEVKTPTE